MYFLLNSVQFSLEVVILALFLFDLLDKLHFFVKMLLQQSFSIHAQIFRQH